MTMPIDENSDINYKVPLSPCDGTIVAINPNGMVNLLFYQTRKMTGDHIDKADITWAVLMNVKDLRNYRNAINENLENFKEQEK